MLEVGGSGTRFSLPVVTIVAGYRIGDPPPISLVLVYWARAVAGSLGPSTMGRLAPLPGKNVPECMLFIDVVVDKTY